MINIEVIHDHRNGWKAGRVVGPIEVRIIHNRKAYYISTGVRVHYKNFVGGRIINEPEAKELNERLVLLVTRVQDEVNRCIENEEPIDVVSIKRKVWQIDVDNSRDSAPLLDWCEEQIPMMRLRPGTRKRYGVLMNRLREWGMMVRWQDVTVENIYKWDAWLHQLRNVKIGAGGGSGECDGNEDAVLSDAAVYNYHKCLKALLNRSVNFGRLSQNPYERLKGQFSRGERENVEYLTEDEMRMFCETRPPVGSIMDAAHDLFVFQMYTGLSYADTQAFDIKEYKRVVVEVDAMRLHGTMTDSATESQNMLQRERWVHIGERVKTGVPYVSQLLPPAVEVLRKYGWQTPKIANAKYNICLKALGMVAGIDIPLHSHVARHTFATWMLKQGVRIENVSKMLGHTNIMQTQRYAKVLAEDVYADFDRVAVQMNQTKKK